MKKISGIYKITNTITNDFYIGSSKNVKNRWAHHKIPSTWNRQPNSQLYKDMKKFGVDKFSFEILAEVEEGQLKEMEQQFIEKMHPTYNSNRANGLDIERRKESNRKANNKYQKSHRESLIKSQKKYYNQLCFYNGETLTLCALRTRFTRQGIPHPVIEAKKYLLN